MDERGQALEELKGYGGKLLEEMRQPKLIDMLQETMEHLHNVAIEYSREADDWHSKYDMSQAENEKLRQQLADIKKLGETQNDEWLNAVNNQSKVLKSMEGSLQQQFDSIRTHRDSEVDDYKFKVENLIQTQKTLDALKGEVETAKQDLEEKIRLCDEEKANCEAKRVELEEQINLNRDKITGYEELDQKLRNAQSEIANVQNAADDKINAANATAADWERKYGEEYSLRVKLEEELANLKQRLQSSDANKAGENADGQEQSDDVQPSETQDDDDDDSTK